MRGVRNIIWALLAGIWMSGAVSAAENPNLRDAFLFSADEVTNNQELGIISARGNVEISQGERILLANSISYNQRQNIVSATGGVSLLEPSGEVLFAEYMELTGDLKDGIIKDLRIRLSDNARIAAAGARRSGGNRTEMRQAVYSPCETCANQPQDTPLWQVKAKKIVHDQKAQTIEYSDAFLEIMGLPVAYTPYFSHPDPTVKRKTGFLTPSFGGNSFLGTVASAPYFINLAPNRDITLKPTLTSKERLIMEGEYRAVTDTSGTDFTGSFTYNSENEFRGHVDASYRKDLGEAWRGGADLNLASDDTYLRRYGFSSPNTLVSRSFLEGFQNRSYMLLDAYHFQGLGEEDDPGNTPIVLPMFEFNHVGQPNRFGATSKINLSSVALTRREGHDTRRFSVEGGWHIPHIGSFGEVIDINLSLRGDMYHVTNFNVPGQQGNDSGVTGRIYPQAKVDWRLPLRRRDGTISQTLEPLVSVVISPYGGNPNNIPNEDSEDLEFDDTNLYSANRFTGWDRVDGGPRTSYGLKWSAFGDKGGGTSVFFGQSYRVRSDDTFGEGSGLEDNFSDIVGRLRVSPGDNLDLSYRTRIDKDDLSPRRSEVSVAGGPPALRLSTNYVFFDRQEDSDFGGREEISGSINAKLNRNWKSNFSSVYDLEGGGELRRVSLGFTYDCECFVFSATLRRDFFEDRDLKPSDSILFRLTFKTLGDVQTAVSASGS
jgi:LPS-assembly protein